MYHWCKSIVLPRLLDCLKMTEAIHQTQNTGVNNANAKPLRTIRHTDRPDAGSLQDYCTGKIGAMGVCLGGHLAFRAAINPAIKSAFCLYATDIHSGAIPSQAGNDTLSRSAEIKGEVLIFHGR